MSRPRLLFLGHVLPWPPDSGVAIRTYHTLRLLSTRFDVTALCFYRAKAQRGGSALDRNVSELSKIAEVTAFPIPQEQSRARLLRDHMSSVMTARPYTWYAYDSDEYRSALRNVDPSSFDLVHVDSLDLCVYLNELPLDRTVLVHHNVESELIKRRAENAGRTVRPYLYLQSRLLQKQERHWLDKVTLNIAVSDDDAGKLRELGPRANVQVMPNGVDVDYFRDLGTSGDSIVFMGGLEWFPNVDALEWFGETVLPILRERGYGGSVRWVGRAEPDETQRYRDRFGIEATGYVDDVRTHVSDAACTVVPLRIGGGTRLKITTAWAMGKPVVTTSIGCEGLDARNGDNALITDSPVEMADAIDRLLHDKALRDAIGSAGRRTAEQQYAWDVVGEPMLQSYSEIIAARR